MPNNIRFRLEKFERVLVMQILDQDEFSLDSGLGDFESKLTGWTVESSDFPEIYPSADDKLLYLRGADRARDLEILTAEYETNADRDKAFMELVITLREWSQWIDQKKAEAREREDSPPVEEPVSLTVFHF